jgi:transcriptional antiterminator RfaH
MRAEDIFLAEPSVWAVVNTQPHREHIALENLARQGFRAYCPQIRKRVAHARRVHEVLRPLFPGYLFVNVSLHQQRWRPILSTLGVRTLVRFGEQPALLEDGFIQNIKSREIDGAIVRPARAYQVGQKVRVAGGAFDGLVATIIEMDEKDRLVVLMSLLNRQVKATVTATMVVPA